MSSGGGRAVVMTSRMEIKQVKEKPKGAIAAGIIFAVISILAYLFQSFIDFQALLLLLPLAAGLLIAVCLSPAYKIQYILFAIILALFLVIFLILGNLRFNTIFGLGGPWLHLYFIIVVLALTLLNGIALLIHLLQRRITVVLIIEVLITVAFVLPLFLYARSALWGVLFLAIFISKCCAYIAYNRNRLAAMTIEAVA